MADGGGSESSDDGGATMTRRTDTGRNSHVIPVSNGLLKHRGQIGAAVWTFLWFIDRVTSERPSETRPSEYEGLVLGGAPINTRRIAQELEQSLRSTQRHIDRLCAAGYILTTAKSAGEACSFVVRKSKKWTKSREVIMPEAHDNSVMGVRQNRQGGMTEVAGPHDRSGVAIRKDNTGTAQGQVRDNSASKGSSESEKGNIPLTPRSVNGSEKFDAQPYVTEIIETWPGERDESYIVTSRLVDAFAEESARQRVSVEEAARTVTSQLKGMAAVLRQNPSEVKFKTLRSVLEKRSYRTPLDEWKVLILGAHQQGAKVFVPLRSASEEARAQQGGVQ